MFLVERGGISCSISFYSAVQGTIGLIASGILLTQEHKKTGLRVEAKVVEHLPSKYKALSSSSPTHPKKSVKTLEFLLGH
jgi:hypothetical protein